MKEEAEDTLQEDKPESMSFASQPPMLSVNLNKKLQTAKSSKIVKSMDRVDREIQQAQKEGKANKE